ncbi:uncharacterized protein LOC144628201 [Oculina patagonica]
MVKLLTQYIFYGRPALFAVLAIFQAYGLTNFLVKYKDYEGWYAIAPVFFPAFLAWWWHTYDLTGRLRWLCTVWLLHVGIGLIPTIGTIFGLIENDLQRGELLSPGSLKLILCVSPLLLLILLNNPLVKTDSNEYHALITDLSYKMTIDFFDGVDMLGLVLQESEISHGIPTSFEKAIVAFACIGFLLSPLDLFGHKVQQDGLVRGSNTAVSMRIVVQVFINALFLGVRVAVHIEYGADASIFITKNVIMILIPIFKTISFLKCCEKDPEDELEI